MSDTLKLADELIRARDVAGVAGSAPRAATIELLDGHLRAALELVGVRVLDATGVPLDDRVHEVHAIESTADPERHGVVAETVVAGYALGARLLRPQQVVVGRFEETPR